MTNELRWNPILGEWIIVAAKREKRPWRPNYCPFCPGSEETGEGWRVLVLPNRYPALGVDAEVATSSKDIYCVKPGYGYCEVVIETPMHEGDLCDLSLEHLKEVIDAFSQRYVELGRDPKIKYVFEFRNKGAAIGVSLHHPHSQIYALPFIPPRVKRELDNSRKFYKKNGRCLFCRILELEYESKSRILYENADFTVFLPFFAMWPYEVHVYPRRHVQNLPMLTEEERYSLADALKVITKAYNMLFDMNLPYIMAVHQSPTDGGEYKYYHLHIEFYPPNRDANKLKYAAGIEWGAGVFTYDGLPEERAMQLKKAVNKALNDLEKKEGYKALGAMVQS